MTNIQKRTGIAVLLIAGILAIRFTGIDQYMSLGTIKEHAAWLQTMVQQHYGTAVFGFIMLYLICVAIGLPAAAVLTIVSGFLFGTLWGAVYSNIGATAGAIISFLMVRYIIGALVQERYARQLAWFNHEMKLHGTSYLLVVHFIAVIPFVVINFLAGLTNVTMWTFIWTTSVGIFPGALVYAFAGQQLHNIHSPRDIFSLPVICAFALLALLAMAPVIIKRVRVRRGMYDEVLD